MSTLYLLLCDSRARSFLGKAKAKLLLSVWKGSVVLGLVCILVVYDTGGLGNLCKAYSDTTWPKTWARKI